MTDTTELPADIAPVPYSDIDAPAPDVKPRRTRNRKPADPLATPRQRKPRTSTKPATIDLRVKLAELLTLGGMMAGLANPIDGLIITNNADQLASALAKLAEENEQVRKVLTSLVTGSAWGGVLLAVGSIALPIAANHGISVPAGDAMLAPYRALMPNADTQAGS
jgi:hypothetical protein